MHCNKNAMKKNDKTKKTFYCLEIKRRQTEKLCPRGVQELTKLNAVS